MNYHNQEVENCIKELDSSKNGLKQEEVKKRLERDGLNSLKKKKSTSAWAIFFSQFKNPLIYILLGAGVVSLVLGEKSDAWVIFGAVFINTVIGFFQENKANNALEKLHKMVEHEALVIRDGKKTRIKSKELVKGDIIILEAGNRVPADARVMEGLDLQINESNLTGESLPVEKTNKKINKGVSLGDRKNMAYSSTVIVKGSGKAVVTGTGVETEIGKISEMVRETKEEKTPLQKRLGKLSKFIGIAIGIICLLVLGIGLLNGMPFLDMFIIAIALAVASIPEGLIVAVTVILVLGMQQILKKKALTRKLVAAETLGSTTVICTDKTGTLTEGKMQVTNLMIGDKNFSVKDFKKKSSSQEDIKTALEIALLCNHASFDNSKHGQEVKVIGSATETALFWAGIDFGLNKEHLENNKETIGELPFSSKTKFMATFFQNKDKSYTLYEKGAPERVLEKCSQFSKDNKIVKLTDKERKELIKNYEKLTKKGLRVIAVAKRDYSKNKKIDREKLNWEDLDKDLTLIGLFALKDPLRKEAKETIEICQKAGIKPIIITGDHKLTAQAIARDLGFKTKDEHIIEGEALDKIGDEELEKMIKEINVFARVSPHHKLRIIKALQKQEEVVAMTGDGLNDSPALKAADIGVCLGSGTDIAKETSDIVLLDNNFKVIVAAVKQGRIIFSNIRKVITYLIGDSFSEVILIVGSIIAGTPLAILPAQILWVNIVNDGLPNFALAFEKEHDDVMARKPIKRKEPIINKEMKFIILGAGTVANVVFLFIYFYLLKQHNDIQYIRTMIFGMVGFDSLLYIFSLRSFYKPLWKMNPFSNRYLVGAVLISLVLLLLGIYWSPMQNLLSTTALDVKGWAWVIGASIFSLSLIELTKFFFIIKRKKE